MSGVRKIKSESEEREREVAAVEVKRIYICVGKKTLMAVW
jgi:hypothetical protein